MGNIVTGDIIGIRLVPTTDCKLSIIPVKIISGIIIAVLTPIYTDVIPPNTPIISVIKYLKKLFIYSLILLILICDYII